MTTFVRAAGTRLACAVALALASVSCGDMARDGQASSYLIMNSLAASRGGTTPDRSGATSIPTSTRCSTTTVRPSCSWR